jgi:hypothetical protein
MPTDESALLLRTFQFLVDRLGFSVVAGEASSSFDNVFIELTNGLLNIRIARERGIKDAEMSPACAHDRWLPVSHLRQVALGGDPVDDVTLEQQADFVSGHYSTIVKMLAPEQLEDTVARVDDLGRERLKRLFPGSIVEE